MLRLLTDRENDGISVSLFYETNTGETVIALIDTRTDLQTMFPVPCEKALDAFNHPFVYAQA